MPHDDPAEDRTTQEYSNATDFKRLPQTAIDR